MTHEEKQLLLKYLCGCLPYGVKFSLGNNNVYTIKGIDLIVTDEGDWEYAVTAKGIASIEIKYIKPYLRPISSMKEKEIDILFNILDIDKSGKDKDWIKINDALGIKFFFPTGKWIDFVADALDYLNTIHVDYLGLIEMGLAFEAPEGMYKTE